MNCDKVRLLTIGELAGWVRRQEVSPVQKVKAEAA
jgi:hypothetical protein